MKEREEEEEDDDDDDDDEEEEEEEEEGEKGCREGGERSSKERQLLFSDLVPINSIQGVTIMQYHSG
ncbi:Hypothetical predicted protein [Octopus vulgaris]|uniref:Uncharacterized protein n=1 Tax=Octopus vulgaris TaxID=6645 RepID=A0AA36FH43_OCTVU|nr:Hypothetical predicted protein [Octopus vulgaris]